MSKEVALILSIVILAILVATFIVTFVLYKKTPVPAGCETIRGGEECKNCSNPMCDIHKEEDK